MNSVFLLMIKNIPGQMIAFSNDDLRFLNNLFAKHKYDYNVILSDKINISNNSYIPQQQSAVYHIVSYNVANLAKSIEFGIFISF